MKQYAARIEKLSSESGNTALSSIWITEPCCIFTEDASMTGCQGSECKKARDSALKLLKDREKYPIERVVWGQYWGSYLNGLESIGDGKEQFELRKEKISKFINELNGFGVETYVVMSAPTGSEFNPRSMLSRDFSGGFKIGSAEVLRGLIEKRNHLANEIFTNLQADFGFHLLNPLETLCSKYICPIVSKDGFPLLMDNDHLSMVASRDLATYMDITVVNKVRQTMELPSTFKL